MHRPINWNFADASKLESKKFIFLPARRPPSPLMYDNAQNVLCYCCYSITINGRSKFCVSEMRLLSGLYNTYNTTFVPSILNQTCIQPIHKTRRMSNYKDIIMCKRQKWFAMLVQLSDTIFVQFCPICANPWFWLLIYFYYM